MLLGGRNTRSSGHDEDQPSFPFSEGESDHDGSVVDVDVTGPTGAAGSPQPQTNARSLDLDSNGFDVADHMSDYSPSLPGPEPAEPASLEPASPSSAATPPASTMPTPMPASASGGLLLTTADRPGPGPDAKGAGSKERTLPGDPDSDSDSDNFLKDDLLHLGGAVESDSQKLDAMPVPPPPVPPVAVATDVRELGKRKKSEPGRAAGGRGRGSASIFQEDTIWFGDTPLVKRNDTAAALSVGFRFGLVGYS